MEQMTERDRARFWTKVKVTDYCWLWEGSKNTDNYGIFKHVNETSAHRISYQLLFGNIKKSDCVLHKCDNPSCVNPDHLWIGTHKENMEDKVKKGRSRMLGRSSKYYGVTWRSDSKRWKAYLIIDKKMKTIGCFGTEEEAAKAYDIASLKEFGKNARLNFSPQSPKE